MIGPTSETWTEYVVGEFPPVPPPAPDPEPRIGPGMILERGRERVVISMRSSLDGRLYLHWHRRKWNGDWPAEPDRTSDRTDPHIRYLLLSGFKIIRPADEESAHA